MSTPTKKEKIRKLFEIIGIEEVIKDQRVMIRADTTMATLDQEAVQGIITEFTEKMLEVLKSSFVKIVDERFTKFEIEKFIAIYSDPLFKRLLEVEGAIGEQVAPDMAELVAEEQMKLMFLLQTSRENTSEDNMII